MRMRTGPLALAISAVALLGCSDRVDPVTALAPGGLDAGPISLSSTAPLPNCGFEDGAACGFFNDTLPRCDRGLQLNRMGTPLPGDDICVNDTRHLVGAGFRGTWTDWALANQRTLAVDEPLNWVQHLTTHNANNNIADGETGDPNQVWSMSDQLDLGSRMLWLDPHWTFGEVRLCHPLVIEVGPDFHIGCTANDRLFAYAVREIATWLTANPDEIILIDLEAYVEGHFDEVSTPLEEWLGTKLYRTSERTPGSAWPSRRELRAMGRQVIVGARGGPEYVGDDHFGGTTHGDHVPGTQNIRFIKHFTVGRTDGIVTECSGGDPSQSLLLRDAWFRVVGEDRTSASLLVNLVGIVRPEDVPDMVGCGLPLVSFDMLSSPRAVNHPRIMFHIDRLFQRGDLRRVAWYEPQPLLVWSWEEGDRGSSGDAALLRGSDGRWSSVSPSEQRRFACGRPRSETTRQTADWADTLGIEWRITTRSGTWREGGRACLDEYGHQGFVFSVPVSSHMNGRLRLADAARGDVWINYNDIKQEGDWVINQRPLANAGADRIVECNGHHGTTVQLDGTQSTDPDGDQLTFEWQGPFGTASGAQPTVLLPLGTHVIRMIADDGFGGVRVDEVVIQVVDTTPPEIRSAIPTPAELWAPNHKMVPVTIAVDVHDICDATPTCRIVSVASNEPANGSGDGNTPVDWELTGALTLNLRAERSGNGNGRVYTIIVECVDDSGNASTAEVKVTVAHDQGRP